MIGIELYITETKWNEETCRAAAKQCISRADFLKKNGSAYNVARRNGWLDDYDWFKEPKKQGYWNEETCRAAAKECTSRGEFKKKHTAAYRMARINGWLDDYEWFEEIHHKKGYWTKETCEEESHKYKTRTQFCKGSSSAYDVAKKNGWLDDYTWLKDERFDLYKDKIDSVYVYEFPELNAAYVGRTLMRTQQDRDRAHIFNTEKDAVAKFAKENDVQVPKPKYLELDLTLDQGAKLEGYWEKYYREHGWNMLNRAKTGSIGGLGKGKWNKEACERAARECTSRMDFHKKYISAYNVSWKNGWLDDYDWFEKKRHEVWTEETCLAAAKECTSRGEFAKKYVSAYEFARKNGLLDTYDWFLDGHKIAGNKRAIWNEETCRAVAKECTSIADFRKKNASAWNVAHKNGWIKDYTWFKEPKKQGYWNEETCREAAKECTSRKDFEKKYIGAYTVARKNNWLDDYTWFKPSKFKHLKECLISDIKPLSAYINI